MNPVRPKDAATLIVLRRDRDAHRVLMGRRSQAHAFMPGSVVFPGGRVDRADRHGPAHDELHPAVAHKLSLFTARPTPVRLRALALAAIRETCEETGVLIGRQDTAGARKPGGPWAPFFDNGVVPSLASLRLVARAVTPPRHNRRFDARFFAVFEDAVAGQLERADGELQAVAWLSFDEARDRALPEITRMVLDNLENRLRQDPELDPHCPLPFFFVRRGVRCVEQL